MVLERKRQATIQEPPSQVDAAAPPTALPPSPCGDYRTGTDFEVCSATYLGSDVADEVRSIAVTKAAVVVAGDFGTLSMDAEQHRLFDGPGSVVRLTRDGRSALSVTRVSNGVRDMVTASDGSVIVAGDDEIVQLSADAASIAWSHPVAAPAERVSVGQLGSVVALTSQKEVLVLDSGGNALTDFALSDPAVNDVAIDDDNESLYVVGARNVSDCPGTIPFLRSYDFTGALKWTAYDFEMANGQCAASQGRRVVLGADGMLYYAGENHGGNTVHLRDPRDVDAIARLEAPDNFTSGWGKAIEVYSFVARFSPDTGELQVGSMLLPRDADNTGGTLRVGGLAADEFGNVYLGATASCCLADRASLAIAGQNVGNAPEREGSLVILAADFTQRWSWVTWTESSDSEIVSVAAAGGVGAVALNQLTADTSLIDVAALLPEPRGDIDGFVSVFPTPRSSSIQP